jgi:hypothetical protein
MILLGPRAPGSRKRYNTGNFSGDKVRRLKIKSKQILWELIADWKRLFRAEWVFIANFRQN